jgi:hypothetical protein
MSIKNIVTGQLAEITTYSATGQVQSISIDGPITTTATLTADQYSGNASGLSQLTGANVTGEVATANVVSNPLQPVITQVGTLTGLTTGTLDITGQFTANSNAQFNGDVFFSGNVTLPGVINQISGNSGEFFGDPATGFGALYVGIPSGFTLLNNEVAQFADNFNGYTQVTHRNIIGGDQATGDFVISADNGTDVTNYIDIGIAGSGYNGLLANNSLGTVLYTNDSYLYAKGDTAGGNIVIGTIQTGAAVRIIAGASNIADVVATFTTSGVQVANAVTAGSFVGNGSGLTNLPTPLPVIGTVASAAVITPTSTSTQYNVTALTETTAFAAPSGTPTDGQKLTIRILDNGTSRAMSWNAIYRAVGPTLPLATVPSKVLYVGAIWNAQSNTWDVVSVAQEV